MPTTPNDSLGSAERSCRNRCVWGSEGCTRNVCPMDSLEAQKAAAMVRHKQQLICPMLARVAGGGACLDFDIDAAARLTVFLVEAKAIGGVLYRRALDQAAATSRSGRLAQSMQIKQRILEEAFERNRVGAVSGSSKYVEALASDYGMDDSP